MFQGADAILSLVARRTDHLNLAIGELSLGDSSTNSTNDEFPDDDDGHLSLVVVAGNRLRHCSVCGVATITTSVRCSCCPTESLVVVVNSPAAILVNSLLEFFASSKSYLVSCHQNPTRDVSLVRCRRLIHSINSVFGELSLNLLVILWLG